MKQFKTKQKVKTIASVLRAGGHPIRVQILQLLKKKGETSVNDVVSQVDASQSLTSHHLMLLTREGYIKKRREGKFIFYSIASEKLYGLLVTVAEIIKSEK